MKRISLIIWRFLLPLLVLSMFFSTAYACTGFRIITKNNSVIYARTNEFAIPLHSQMLFIPRGAKYIGFTTRGLL